MLALLLQSLDFLAGVLLLAAGRALESVAPAPLKGWIVWAVGPSWQSKQEANDV